MFITDQQQVFIVSFFMKRYNFRYDCDIEEVVLSYSRRG